MKLFFFSVIVHFFHVSGQEVSFHLYLLTIVTLACMPFPLPDVSYNLILFLVFHRQLMRTSDTDMIRRRIHIARE